MSDAQAAASPAALAAPKRRPWQFPDSEVKILTGDDSFLGKGAYGEVRRGMWRGIPVAAKRLHMLKGGEAARCASIRGIGCAPHAFEWITQLPQ